MIRVSLRFAAVMLAALSTLGCSEDAPSSDVGCNARIEWNGVVYRPHNELNQAAPRGDRLGRGEVLDCDGTGFAKADVFALNGVKTSVAIGIDRGEWRGVYVAEDVPATSWPEVLKSG